ncbi:MAG: hypothetical protein WBX19_06115 [Terracidiphilus sp.]
MPHIGSATGEGAIAESGAINSNLNAKLNSSNAVGAVTNTAMNAVGGIAGMFLHPTAKPASLSNRGIVLTITGTAASPSIKANIGAMLK